MGLAQDPWLGGCPGQGSAGWGGGAFVPPRWHNKALMGCAPSNAVGVEQDAKPPDQSVSAATKVVQIELPEDAAAEDGALPFVSSKPKPRKRLKSRMTESDLNRDLEMKLDEDGTVDAESDTKPWALKRMETLSRLAPYRLLRHVMRVHRTDERSEVVAINQEEFFDTVECAALFIEISGFSHLTANLVKQSGLEGIDSLAAALNLYLGKVLETLTRCGGDVIKFAGDAALVIFPVTKDADLAQQTLKAVQLSLECILQLEEEVCVVEGVTLTAHSGIGVGEVTGFLVGGVFNRSEYAVIGDPVFQIASAEPAAGNGETVISAEAWALIEPWVEGQSAPDDNWLVTAVKEGQSLNLSAGSDDGFAGITGQLASLSKDAANNAAAVVKMVVPGGVRNRLTEFTPASIPAISEFRHVTMLFARLTGLDHSNGRDELKKIQRIVRLIQETIYAHDGNFLRFSVDDKGAVVMGVYGLPPSHGNDEERGVLAALDFCTEIHTLSEQFGGVRASVGLTTGYCWLGLVGGISRCEYTTHGPLINMAARLMCASQDRVTCDTATMEACKRSTRHVKFEAKPPIKVKGRDELVEIFVPEINYEVTDADEAKEHARSKLKALGHLRTNLQYNLKGLDAR